MADDEPKGRGAYSTRDVAALEWEPLGSPRKISVGHSGGPFKTGVTEARLFRDAEMNLRVEATGSLPREEAKAAAWFPAPTGIAVGTLIGPTDFKIPCSAGTMRLRCSPLAWKHCLPEITEPSVQLVESGTVEGFEFTRSFQDDVVPADGNDILSGCTVERKPARPAALHTDWFINGPADPVFLRWTSRIGVSRYVRERETGSFNVSSPTKQQESRDYFLVDAGSIQFAVSRVPSEYSEEWLRSVGIEYRSPIPEREVRAAIQEVVSFALGRPLIGIGSTSADDQGRPLEEIAVSPHEPCLRALCRDVDNSPLGSLAHSSDIERILGQLVPAYLRKRDTMRLQEALAGYWLACRTQVPICLALFGSALDVLKLAWFKSTKSKSGGLYMANAAYQELLAPLVGTVQEELQSTVDSETATKIARKILGANQVGNNEQLPTFLREIGLALGKAELDAVKGRNKAAHGGVFPGDDFGESVVHAAAYRTLFERVVLRLLDYDGEYVDRTVLGWPMKRLEVPTGIVGGDAGQ